MKNKNKVLANAILDIIKEWSKDMIWHGFDAIYDELKDGNFPDIKMTHIKREIKNLKDLGLIERMPLFNEDNGNFGGSGYFFQVVLCVL